MHKPNVPVLETSAKHATEYTLFSLNSKDWHKTYTVNVEVEGQELTMEIADLQDNPQATLA